MLYLCSGEIGTLPKVGWRRLWKRSLMGGKATLEDPRKRLDFCLSTAVENLDKKDDVKQFNKLKLWLSRKKIY